MAQIFVGIDPGKAGAISILQGNRTEAFYTPLRVTRTKLKKKTKSGKPKVQVTKRYGTHLMYILLKRVADAKKAGHTVLVVLERQAFRPWDSKSTIAQSADGYAVWRTIVELLCLPFVEVQPSSWKPKYVEAGSVKAVSVRACQKLYPKLDLSLAKSEALAEAVLLADYMRRKTLGRDYPSQTMMTPQERAESAKKKQQKATNVKSHEARIASKVGKANRRTSPMLRAAASLSENRNRKRR